MNRICTSRTTVTATYPLQHLCPYRDEVDSGTVEITWRTHGATFELHDLGAFLATFAGKEFSHEQLTAFLAALLHDRDGLTVVEVLTRWTTAGAEVVCRAVPRESVHAAGA